MFKPEVFELSIEQEFSIRSFNSLIEQLSAEQSRELLISLLHQLAIKDNIIKDLLKKSMG